MISSSISNSSVFLRPSSRLLRVLYRPSDHTHCSCLGSKGKTKHELQGIGPTEEKSPSNVALISGVAGVGAIIALSAFFKNDIQQFLEQFATMVEAMGVAGYFSYAGLYIVLETVAVPATPLTLTAGYLFGIGPGVCIVSIASTIAATLAFSISRYLFREKAVQFFSKNKQFGAIDRATAKDGFKFIFLLRLSPLLPFAASNYLYGVTAVKLDAFVAASWLGMLPGTWAYISAGSIGRSILSEGGSGPPAWELFLAVAVTVVVLYLTGTLAKDALKEIEEEERG